MNCWIQFGLLSRILRLGAKASIPGSVLHSTTTVVCLGVWRVRSDLTAKMLKRTMNLG